MPRSEDTDRFLRELFQEEEVERIQQLQDVQEPWDFWGNIVRFWGLSGLGLPGFSRREKTYVNPQWGKENISLMKDILEE